jgi:hypothetical protein
VNDEFRVMNVRLLLAGMLFLAIFQLSVTERGPQTATAIYAGVYRYGDGNDRSGTVTVYPESDSTVLFYLDVNRGAPSYNMGMLYGRLTIRDSKGTYRNRFDYSDNGCELGFVFGRKELTVTTLNDQGDCGFGFAVYADGTFRRSSSRYPEYFVNAEGTKVWFRSTSPESHNRD